MYPKDPDSLIPSNSPANERESPVVRIKSCEPHDGDGVNREWGVNGEWHGGWGRKLREWSWEFSRQW